MIVAIGLLLKKLFLLPHFLFLIIIDYIFYIKNKGYKNFEGWGLHIYVGKFGAGKTATMVYHAYLLAKKYTQLTIVTNLKLINFPEHTQILPLKSPQDILNAPVNSLVLIDEIGTIFNSRDFAKSKDSVPKILFQHLCQCRKRRLQIFATAQRWNFMDKQLRDITATVRVTRTSFGHPFSRLSTVRCYDSVEYDMAYNNPLLPLNPLWGDAYIQTNKIRNFYDTAELIQSMLSAEYISDDEILANQQGISKNLVDLDKKAKGFLKRQGGKLVG